MSKYTTGELAKLCGVSIRTVQYYDARGILIPHELSEGGRRLYSEEDFNQMRIICFLRDLEFPIDSIKQLLKEDRFEAVITLLLDEQEGRLHREIAEKQNRADKIAEVKKALRRLPSYSVESIGDIAYIMENKRKMWRLYGLLLALGLLADIIQISTLILWIITGIWLPFVIGLIPVTALSVWISVLYFKKTCFICPNCHNIFQPKFSESFFAYHTPYMRKLTCPACKHRGFCVETYRQEESHVKD